MGAKETTEEIKENIIEKEPLKAEVSEKEQMRQEVSDNEKLETKCPECDSESGERLTTNKEIKEPE